MGVLSEILLEIINTNFHGKHLRSILQSLKQKNATNIADTARINVF